jgi:flagellar biosynthetic protein FliR
VGLDPVDGGAVNAFLRQFSEQQVAAFMLVIARVAPLFVLAPMFSSKMIPGRVKGIAAVGLAVGLAPIAMQGRRVPLDVYELGALAVKELLVGLAFSLAIAVLFAAVSAAGSMADTLIGFSFGSLVDPVTGNHSSLLSQLYSLVGVGVFIAIDGDAWVVRGLGRTYELVPLTGWPALAPMVGGVQHAFAGIFVAAVELAAPVMLAVLITDVAFGVVARVVPQLNVFAVGFPAKVIVGMLVLGVSLPFAAHWISDQLQESVGAALQSLRLA